MPRCARHAVTMLEVMISLVLFLLMVLMVGIVVPSATRTSQYSADYLMASSLVMHKLNQVQEAGYHAMNGPGLGQSGKQVIDGNPATPSAVDNDDGDQSASFEFTATDNLWQYFSGGRSAADRSVASSSVDRPRGYLEIEPYAPSQRNLVYEMIRVTATVAWKNSRGQVQRFTASTLVPRDAGG